MARCRMVNFFPAGFAFCSPGVVSVFATGGNIGIGVFFFRSTAGFILIRQTDTSAMSPKDKIAFSIACNFLFS